MVLGDMKMKTTQTLLAEATGLPSGAGVGGVQVGSLTVPHSLPAGLHTVGKQ